MRKMRKMRKMLKMRRILAIITIISLIIVPLTLYGVGEHERKEKDLHKMEKKYWIPIVVFFALIILCMALSLFWFWYSKVHR